MTDVWTHIAAERRLVADDLQGLPDEAWSATTTCGGWTVQQLVAHLTVPLTTTRREAVVAVLQARGNVDRGIAAMTMARATQPPTELVRTLRDLADHRFAPPGLGPRAPLTDVVVHGVELRRATGVERPIAADRARIVLGFLGERKARTAFTKKGVEAPPIERIDLHDPVGVEDLLLRLTGR